MDIREAWNNKTISTVIDGKRRIFVIQPTPPYDNGDLWIKDNEIYICQISKKEGQPYQEQDFINNLKYISLLSP